MSKIRKSFLRSSVMMLAVMALSSGVAYAQDCQARAASGGTPARAEGLSEAVKAIDLACKTADASDFFGDAPIPDEIELTIELNTTVSNGFKTDLSDERIVDGLTYTPGTAGLGVEANYQGSMTEDEREVLSSDKTMISWTLDPADLSFVATAELMSIGGIMVDASALGDGADVTAVVRVNGEAVHSGSLKLADVTTGLEVTVTPATGLQCEDTEATGTIRFVEGFNAAIPMTDSTIDTDSPYMIVLNFRNIPDEVSVSVSTTGVGMAMDDDGGDLAPLTLNSDEDAHEMGAVILSAAGAGSVVYTFDEEDPATTTDLTADPPVNNALEGTDDTDEEWNDIEVTFEWDANDPPLSSGTVTLSYHPASGDNARFVHGTAMNVVTVGDCETSMLFPFVTNMHGFDTGVAITNTSEVNGSCMIEYSGTGAPMEDGMVMVDAGSTTTFGLSMMAPGFQGYLDVTCDYRNGKGLAFITNGAGSPGGPTLAHGYVVGEDLEQTD